MFASQILHPDSKIWSRISSSLNRQLFHVKTIPYHVHSLFLVFASRKHPRLFQSNGLLALLPSQSSKVLPILILPHDLSQCLTPREFSLSAVLQHILHLQILLTFTCALLGFSEMFHKWLFDFPKVLVNLIGLGRTMLASLNLIKPGTVH